MSPLETAVILTFTILIALGLGVALGYAIITSVLTLFGRNPQPVQAQAVALVPQTHVSGD